MTKAKLPLIFITISAIIAAIFLSFPNIDLYVAELFYNPEEQFFLGDNLILMLLHKSVRYITITTALVWIGLLVASFIKKRIYFGLSKHVLIYLILALAIGPGLVVNTIFKDNWGRARPHHTQQFGGTKIFTPPFIMSDQCDKNCSFVSGDPSVGFYFFALAFAVPTRRRQFSALALGLGAVFGATRVMQGAHFFSDVIFSGVFTVSVCYILYLALLKKRQN